MITIFVVTVPNDLRLCTTWGQVKPILEKLNAGVGATELAHKSILLKETNDPIQKNHGDEFMEKAIEDIEHNLRENLLPHTNTGSRNRGSSGASDFSNYPQLGSISQDGQTGMTNMQYHVNQWNSKVQNLLEAIQRDVVAPRDQRIKNKNRELSSLHKQVDNQQREIKRLKEINGYAPPVHIDFSEERAFALTRETEKFPRKNSLGLVKPEFDISAFKTQENKNMTAFEMIQLDNELNEKRGVKTLTSYKQASTIVTE